MKTNKKLIKKSRGKWVILGKFGVDSGTMMITDPCYVMDKKDWNKKLYEYWVCDRLPQEEDKGNDGVTIINKHGAAMGTIFKSGYGDGVYEVQGYVKDGIIHRIYIELTGEL